MQLVLDSSGNTTLAACIKDGGLVSELRLQGRDGVLSIDEQVQSIIPGADIKQISSIVVGLGPGSFIGTRVTISFSNGLASTLRIPLYGVESVPALIPQGASLECAALRDARRNEVYALLPGDETTRTLSYDSLLDELAAAGISDVYMDNPGTLKKEPAWLDALRESSGINLHSVDGPDALTLARMAENVESANYVEPVYLRSFL